MPPGGWKLSSFLKTRPLPLRPHNGLAITADEPSTWGGKGGSRPSSPYHYCLHARGFRRPLWPPIDSRRRDEDTRVTIKHHRERRYDLGDGEAQSFSGPVVLCPCMPPALRTIFLPYGVGYQAFTLELRRVCWPKKFWLDLPQKYDSSFDPVEFLQL